MKLKLLFISLLLGCLTCSCGSSVSVSEAENSTSSEESIAETSDAEPENEDTLIPLCDECPILLIQTDNTSSDVMDFITKPVAPHVSEQIATWTPNYVMPPAPYYESCTVTLIDTQENILLDAVAANVKVRGNWTTTYDKKPLRINFSEKQSMLGLNQNTPFKNWLLLAEYKDASLLRDKTALEIARGILEQDNLYASDAAFVEVYVNGEYQGVYLLAEQQQIHENRVEIYEANENDADVNIGYFMEFDGYYSIEEPLQQFHMDYADNAPLIPFDGEDGNGKTMACLPTDSPEDEYKKDIGITIKNTVYNQEQHDFIASYMNNLYTLMYKAAYENKAYCFSEDFTELYENASMTPEEAVRQYVDVDSLADIYIISELTCDADIYWSSFYMDVDFSENGDKKLRFEAPWDFDSSMGNKDRCTDGTGFYAANIVPDVNDDTYETINPWLAVLMYQDWYQDCISKKWTYAYDSGVFDNALQHISDDTAQLQSAFLRNYEKWDNIIHNESFRDELSIPARRCKTQADASAFLKEWLESRIRFLNEYWHT
ncbi:MAG: CotH kinase family protein [Oscillospiraceae bacterium]|nr:CotH kinase family protein [Oscillospiraceae bacterium]